MASKRDCERAMRFQVGQEVSAYPLPPIHSGWSPVCVGTIISIKSMPDINTKFAGIFEIEWTYIGTSFKELLKTVPTIISGEELRFKV